MEQYLEILHTGALGKDLDAYIPIVEKSITRLHQMRELITDVVDWLKIQAPSYARPLVLLDASKAAHAVVDAYRKEAQPRNIVITADIEDALAMKAVAWEIDLMLRHLISNAVRYNKDKGTIHLALKKAGARIHVTIVDSGIGLTEDEQARLFQAFVRIKNSQTQDIRGTGLGLAIVKRLAEFYDGTVSVESEPDKGTTFSLTLDGGI